MSANIEKQFKKKRLWPSIVCFVIAIGMLVTLSIAMLALFSAYIVNSKLEGTRRTLNEISQFVSINADDDTIKNIGTLVKDNYGMTSFALVDSDGNYLGGNCEPTYILDESIVVNADESYYVYPDQRSRESIVDSNGNLKLPYAKLLKNSLKFNVYTGDEHKEILKFDCWIEDGGPDKEVRVLVKGDVEITRSDMYYVMALGAIAMLAICVPLTFMFINGILSIVNQRKMTKLLYTDVVTGADNWLKFKHRSTAILQSRFMAKKAFAVVDVELEKYRSFCIINGANEGDALVRQISDKLVGMTNKCEQCARNNKAEFSLLLNCEDRDQTIERVKDIITELEKLAEGHHLKFNSGIYYIDAIEEKKRKNVNITEYFNNACLARAVCAKSEDKQTELFAGDMLENQLWEHKVEDMMEKALKDGEFVVYLQPKYNPVNEKLSGAEALIRWNSPTEGLISPGRFIPIFEKNGFITKIDDYMISNVARLQSEWIKRGKKVVPVSVNVSRVHFSDANLADRIRELVDEYETPHNVIEIELTESAFFDDKETLLNTVNKLKEYGFEISMDDFGAGYSSLNSLKDLPLDVLKIDAEFFRNRNNVLSDDRSEIVVSEVIMLAKSLNMKTVAEGVEIKEQVDFLAEKGCDMIQGFYFAKPMPASEYEERMD